MNKTPQWQQSFPKLTVRTAQDAKQEKALKDFIKKKEAAAKKTGSWDNGNTN